MEKIDSCEALFLDLWDFLVWFENFTFYTSLAWMAFGFVAGFLVSILFVGGRGSSGDKKTF